MLATGLVIFFILLVILILSLPKTSDYLGVWELESEVPGFPKGHKNRYTITAKDMDKNELWVTDDDGNKPVTRPGSGYCGGHPKKRFARVTNGALMTQYDCVHKMGLVSWPFKNKIHFWMGSTWKRVK